MGYSLSVNDGNQSWYRFVYIEGSTSGFGIGWDRGHEHGFIDGNVTGFSQGYIHGVEDGAGRGYTLRDPTFEEALTFISTDSMDEHEYSDEYNCLNFASEFKRNGWEARYRCGFVYIDFDGGAHLVVCINTTDNDLIFIEPQTGDFVTIGQLYWDIGQYMNRQGIVTPS